MSELERLKNGGDLERHQAAQSLSANLSAEASQALIEALADPGVGEWPGDYDAPPFLYPVAEAAAESLAGRFSAYREAILAQTRVSNTAAFYVARTLRHLVEVEPLLELCRHPYDEARAQAVCSLRVQYEGCGDSRLVTQLLEMMADASSSVTYNSVGEVKALLKKSPQLVQLASPDLVGKLMDRCVAQPGAGTFSEALDFFDQDERVFQFKVDQAAAGYDRPCTLLQYQGLAKLSDSQVERLCQGKLTIPLIQLLGWLGERAEAAAPRLLALVDEAERGKHSVLALLAMPSQASSVLRYVPELYLSDHLIRDRILQLHPDLQALARAVVPRLAPAARRFDGDAFRALAKFGPLAAGEASWLVEMARLGVPDYFRDSAVELLGEFGEAAVAAFPGFYKLLEYSSTRRAVLRALIKLGPVAAEFEVALEVVKLEMQRYAKPDERKLLEQALAAVTSRSGIFPGPSV